MNLLIIMVVILSLIIVIIAVMHAKKEKELQEEFESKSSSYLKQIESFFDCFKDHYVAHSELMGIETQY